MLIIERRAGELIQIGDEIQLCVLDSDGETVRLGVSAPRDIPVRAVEPVASEPPLAERGDNVSDAPQAREHDQDSKR